MVPETQKGAFTSIKKKEKKKKGGMGQWGSAFTTTPKLDRPIQNKLFSYNPTEIVNSNPNTRK